MWEQSKITKTNMYTATQKLLWLKKTVTDCKNGEKKFLGVGEVL